MSQGEEHGPVRFAERLRPSLCPLVHESLALAGQASTGRCVHEGRRDKVSLLSAGAHDCRAVRWERRPGHGAVATGAGEPLW